MSGGFWLLICRLTFVGNAVLFVLLIGGSQNMADDPIDHAPVHIRRQLSVRMDQQPFWGEIYDAQAEWDVVGVNIIEYLQGALPEDEIDGVVVDANPGDPVSITWKGHNGQTATYNFDTKTSRCPDPPVECYSAYVDVVLPQYTGVDQQMRIVVLHTDQFVAYIPESVDRWRTVTHEFGHVLNLRDQDAGPCPSNPNNYHGMMNNGCTDSIYDYQIWDLPEIMVPDEASCVRMQFSLPGKSGCMYQLALP